MFHHLLKTSSSHNEDSLHMVATDWSLLGRYTGFRKSKWCQDSPHTYVHITDALWGDRPDSIALIAEDFVLKDANRIRVVISPSTTPSDIQHAEMRIRHQKTHQDNYQVLTYSASPASPNTCPVCTILCILQHGIRLGLPPLQPLAIRTNPLDPRGFSFVTVPSTLSGSSLSPLLRITSPPKTRPYRAGAPILSGSQPQISFTERSSRHPSSRTASVGEATLFKCTSTFHVADTYSKALDLGIPPPLLLTNARWSPTRSFSR